MAAPEGVPTAAEPSIDLKKLQDSAEVAPVVEAEEVMAIGGSEPGMAGLAVGIVVGLLTLLLIWWLVSRRRLGRGAVQ